MNRLTFSSKLDRTSHTIDDEGCNLAAIQSICGFLKYNIDGVENIIWTSESKYDLTFTITSNKPLDLNSIPEFTHWFKTMCMLVEPIDDNNINIHITYNNSR